MRNIYISALHALLLAIMPTILTSCTQCNAENKGQMKDMQQNRTAGKIVGSYTEETEGIHFTLNGVEFKMVTVEGGTFTMGHNNRQPNEKPEHQVTLSTFWIGETEVTQPLWKAVMGDYLNNYIFD